MSDSLYAPISFNSCYRWGVVRFQIGKEFHSDSEKIQASNFFSCNIKFQVQKLLTEGGFETVTTVSNARLRDFLTRKAVLCICSSVTHSLHVFSCRYYRKGAILLAVLPKASVLGSFIADIPGSNPAEGMGVLLMFLLCVV